MANTQMVQSFLGQTMLVVKANGGSVAVEKQVGGVWVTTDTFSKDGGFLLFLGNTATRFTPSGGAVYEVTR